MNVANRIPDGKGKKVFVGMSGGVDSSVSAALLKRAGFDVTGVFIKAWSPDWMPCPWKEERRDAMRVAVALDIPFITMDFEAEYKKAVVDYMIAEYKIGRTPNPDVMCNRDIKFGVFLKAALAMGADYIATGHYATLVGSMADAKDAMLTLAEGADKTKDQSYFLWTLGAHELAHTIFPVGHLQKSDVRALAKKYTIPTAAKKDSQGICFLGPVDMKEFLAHYLPQKQGVVRNVGGDIIGHHDGALFFTLGERHGFTITEKTNRSLPYYIVKKDIEKNELTVAHEHGAPQAAHTTGGTSHIVLVAVNWNSYIPENGVTYTARFRYRQQPVACTVKCDPQNPGAAEIHFAEPQQDVALGQSLVVYHQNLCLGGGIIDEVRL